MEAQAGMKNPTANQPKAAADESPDPKILKLKRLDKRMKDLSEYLRTRNNGIESMEYFYKLSENIFTGRVKELREFKEKGGKIVGVLCNFVPEEMILAAGAIPIRLAFGFSETILTAEEYLPRNFCPLLKSSFGSFIEFNPLFDLVDVVVIPTSCDGKKKLGELVAPHKPVWILEVPHCTNTQQARDLWLKEIHLFGKRLKDLTGKKVTRSNLNKSIDLVNTKRAVIRRLYEARRKDPALWGRDALLVTSLSYFDEINRFIERTHILCQELEKHDSFAKITTPRIMITGSPLVAPTWKIPVIIEESGGVVVMDDLCTGTKGYWDPVERTPFAMDHLIPIADRYLMNTCACFTPNTARVVRLKQFSEDWRIDGVIYHVSQACHTYGMEQRNVNREFETLDIPVLNIETDFSQEDVEQIRTRVEAFLEMIIARKRRKAAGGKMAKSTGPQFQFNKDFPVHEQGLGEDYKGEKGEKLDIKDLRPPK